MKKDGAHIVKSAAQAEKGKGCDAAELALINAHAIKELTADEVFVFSVTLCDNEIDRDGERFDIPTLHALAPLFTGKSGVFDHNATAKNQTARIVACEVVCDNTRQTGAGESYHCLRARAYMLRTDKTLPLITEIEGGIIKEVSVGCAVGRILCSVCGADVRHSPCGHKPGERAPNGDVCHRILSGALDAYEWSFVAVPAQIAAGVTKAMGGGVCDIERVIKRLGTEAIGCEEGERLREHILALTELAACGRAYRAELEDEVVRLMYAKNAKADCAVLKAAVQGVSVAALRELRALFVCGQENYLAAASQLYTDESTTKESANTEFRI